MKKIAKLTGALLLATALTACSQSGDDGADAAAPACDRACLIDLANDYVAGLESNDASGVNFAADARIVENLNRINAGDGLWSDITGAGTDFSVVVPDEANQTIGWIGMVEREGEPAVIGLRLALDGDGAIAEAEHLYASVPEDRTAERLTTPRAGLLTEVAEESRMVHGDLIDLGMTYYPALDDNDGSLMPFAEDCQRHENGMVTAGAEAGAGPNNLTSPIARDCAGQLTANVMAYITTIDNRRVFAADPVTGLVMGLSHFRHPMDFEPYEVTALDGSVIMYDVDTLPFQPFDLPAAHIFKVGDDGLVHEIEAMGFQAPLNAATGWEEDAPLEEAAAE